MVWAKDPTVVRFSAASWRRPWLSVRSRLCWAYELLFTSTHTRGRQYPHPNPPVMASKSTTGRQLLASARRLQTASRQGAAQGPTQVRCFRAGTANRTDGVFRGLTDTRLPTPWIEAWRLQQDGQALGFAEAHHHERDLSPKKMSDSYHRVVSLHSALLGRCRRGNRQYLTNISQVLPLGRDPWLSDTYINSSGHIR